jgi:hypothetical protein
MSNFIKISILEQELQTHALETCDKAHYFATDTKQYTLYYDIEKSEYFFISIIGYDNDTFKEASLKIENNKFTINIDKGNDIPGRMRAISRLLLIFNNVLPNILQQVKQILEQPLDPQQDQINIDEEDQDVPPPIPVKIDTLNDGGVQYTPDEYAKKLQEEADAELAAELQNNQDQDPNKIVNTISAIGAIVGGILGHYCSILLLPFISGVLIWALLVISGATLGCMLTQSLVSSNGFFANAVTNIATTAGNAFTQAIVFLAV